MEVGLCLSAQARLVIVPTASMLSFCGGEAYSLEATARIADKFFKDLAAFASHVSARNFCTYWIEHWHAILTQPESLLRAPIELKAYK